MSIVVICPHCRSRAQVARNTSGRAVHCTGCRNTFTVPVGTGDLTVEWGPFGAGRRFPLAPPGPFTIGRARDNHLILPGTLVSRRHARLDWVDGEWRVTDLGSSNGTFVNGRRIEQIGVSDAGRIVLGEFALRLALTTSGPAEAETSLDAKALDESIAGATAVVESAEARGAAADPSAETIPGEVPLMIEEGPAVNLPTLAPSRRRPPSRRRLTWVLSLIALLLLGGGVLIAIRQCR